MRASDWTDADEWFDHWGVTSGIAALDPEHVLVPGQTAAQFLEFHSRQETPRGARWMPGVVYSSPGRDLRMHLYARGDRSERRPGLLFVHGGGWREGHPFVHIRHAHAFAQLGYVTATIEYRFLTEAKWPACFDDVRNAIAWLKEHHTELGLDPDQVAVAGGSAGAHLALMLALTVPGSTSAVLNWYPPTDIRFGDTPKELRASLGEICDLFGLSEAELDAVSPENMVSPGAPPILTMTGSDDQLTPVSMIERFHRSLDESGVVNELKVFERCGHAFDFFGGDWYACVAEMARFLRDREGALEGNTPALAEATA